MQIPAHQTYSFDGFTVDLARSCLLRDGEEVKLRPKSFEALKYLVEHTGRLISKEELIGVLWPDSLVTPGSLVQCLRDVRLALGDEEQEYIKTVPRRGYIFNAEVRAAPVEGHSRSGEQCSVPTVGSAQRVNLSKKAWAFLLLPIILTVALFYFLPTRSSKSLTAEPAIKTIAVLPFKPLSADERDEYFGLGMADALITRLGNLRQIIVRPTTSIRKYAEQEKDPLVAGREQRVDAVLEGSIQRSGDKVRVTMRLLNVQDGAALWSYKCEEYCTDVFAVQDTISEKVALALALKLTGEERARLTERYTNNTEAFQAYLLGRYFWNKRTEESMKKGVEYFEQAREQDPRFALAYVGLADSYNVLGFYAYLAPQEAFPRAKAAATEALKLNDRLAEAYNSLAYASLYYDWDWAAAERDFKRALDLNPNYAVAHQWYGNYLTAMGRWEEALAEFKRARELDPLSLVINAVPAWTCFYARQYDRAIDQCHKTFELDQNFVLAHVWLAQAYERKGLRAQAIAELQEALKLAPGAPEVIAALAHAYAASGSKDKARQLLGELQTLTRQRYVSPYHIALAYVGLGEYEQAFTWLEKSFKDRQNILVFIKHDPRLDELRADARFQYLLRRIFG